MNRLPLWSMVIATIAGSTLITTQPNAQSIDPMANLTDGILKQRAAESESCITAPKSTRCLTFRAWHRKWEFDARSWSSKAVLTTARCESGDPFSCYLRGILEMQYSLTYRKAIPWFRQACSQGNAYGCSGLARLGAIDPWIEGQARKVIDRTCAQGFPEGCMMQHRLAVEESKSNQEWASGMSVHLAACESQMLGACEAAGVRFIRAQGVQKDLKRGKALVARACNGGFLRACIAMGLGYAGDLFGKPDLDAAASYYQKACDDEFIWGCSLLGALKMKRPSLTEKQEAIRLHTKACDRGSAVSCGDLGMIYLRGWADVRNESRGVSLLSFACEKGDADDCNSLGKYFSGAESGSPKDLAKSASFFKKACALGHQDACNRQGP